MIPTQAARSPAVTLQTKQPAWTWAAVSRAKERLPALNATRLKLEVRWYTTIRHHKENETEVCMVAWPAVCNYGKTTTAIMRINRSKTAYLSGPVFF